MTTGERMRERRKEIGLSAEKVAEKLGVSPATVYRYENGDIDKVPGDLLAPIAAALQTTPAYLMGWEAKENNIPMGFLPPPTTHKVPLVGRIACGLPILAEENIEDYIDVPEGQRVDFCLACAGDSMIDAGIQDGDVVYIRKQPNVENGQIAAVRIGEEATLKRVYRNGNTLTLMPANSAFPPLVFTAEQINDICIEGKMVGFTHWC